MAKDIRNLIESALSQHLAAQISGSTVYKGTGNSLKAAPCIIVTVGSATEDPPYSAIYSVPVMVTVKSVAKGDTGEHDTLCTSVRDELASDFDTLNTALRTYESTLWVYGSGAPDTLETDVEDDVWALTFGVELVACAD